MGTEDAMRLTGRNRNVEARMSDAYRLPRKGSDWASETRECSGPAVLAGKWCRLLIMKTVAKLKVMMNKIASRMEMAIMRFVKSIKNSLDRYAGFL